MECEAQAPGAYAVAHAENLPILGARRPCNGEDRVRPDDGSDRL